MVIFDETQKRFVKVCIIKGGKYLRMRESDFTDWLLTKCENDPDDGDELQFLLDLFNPQRPPNPPALVSHHNYLGIMTPFRWVPTLSEWLSRYSMASDEPNSVAWISRIFLLSQKREPDAKNISETAETLRQLGFAPFGPRGPATVKLNSQIPRVPTTVEPQPIELPMPGARIRR